MPSRPAVKFRVYQDGQLQPGMVPLQIQRSAGGQQMDSCTLINDPRYSAMYQQNIAILAEAGTQILVTGQAGNGPESQVFWGKITKQQISIQDGNAGEHRLAVARIEDFHFGIPLTGMAMFNEETEQEQFVDCLQIIFNPIHEHRAVGNKRIDQSLDNGVALFIDPETLSLNDPRQENSRGEFWTLADAVFYACQMCNRDEQYVKNPTIEQLNGLFSAEDIVRHLTLKNGMYLPKILDAILEPFGYHWFVAMEQNDTRRIGMFRRGVGIEQTTVHLGEPLVRDPLTNLAACDIHFDASAAYNLIEGLGGFIEIESTFELIRAWPADLDALATTHPDQLELGYLATHPENKDVWRKWVLNEGWDYFGVRPGNSYAHPYDFSDITFEADDENGDRIANVKRRRFHPTLTCDETGHPIGKVQGCKVEYYNGNTGARNGWQDVTDEVMLCHRECGVYFSGRHPPQEIIRQGASAKIRVTATVQFDVRLRRSAETQGGSPLDDRQRLVLDLRDRFHWRYIADDSIFKARVNSGALLSNESDDRNVLQEYVDEILKAWDQASVNGPLTLEGCDWEFGIGQAITEITGRNINLASREGGDNFPTIVGITYDCQAQRTHLQLDQYRKAKLLRFATDRQGIDGTA